jgi:peptidoglycan/xylan/chitin deacetylase (PgdA/CDA1 family)
LTSGVRPSKRGPTDPDFFSSARSFPISVGSNVRPGELHGYYVDLRFKAEAPSWPPPWLAPRDQQLHVSTAQWGLGAFERYLAGEGEEWLVGAQGAADHFVAEQVRGGPQDGAWLHGMPMSHTFLLRAPWISAMAQGEVASLLARVHRETADERYAEAALRALKPLRVPSARGGTQALLGGGPFYEEYPTSPPSFVLNGAIFAIWGVYDISLALDPDRAGREFADALETLAGNIERWDCGYWSVYDLFPHPLPNVASAAYHALHTEQLRAMQQIAPRPEFERTIGNFERYSRSRVCGARAFATKSAFRMIVPRNRLLAHRLPWSESRRGHPVKPRGLAHSLVLAYHAVSPHWPSSLSVTPERLHTQLEMLIRHGYVGATFAEVARGDVPAKSVAVTFDDGFRSVFEHAFPVLSELGLRGTIFVPAGLMELGAPMRWRGLDSWFGTEWENELTPATWDELRQLRDAGWEIASHTWSHARLPELSDEALSAELVRSRERCASEMGQPCETLAYPYGDYDARVQAMTREAGYAAAASIHPGPELPYSWPRIGVYSVDEGIRYRIKASPAVRRFRSSRFGQALEHRRQLPGRHPS